METAMRMRSSRGSFERFQGGSKDLTRRKLPVKILIYITLAFTLLSAVGGNIFTHLSAIYTPERLFSLSSWGINKGFFWQLLSYAFLQPAPEGVNFSFLFNLGLNCYMLFTVGNLLKELKGVKHLYGLYLFAALFGGLFGYGSQFLAGQNMPFSGPWPALFALFFATSALSPLGEIRFSPMFSLKTKSLLTLLFWANILMDLSAGNYVSIAALVGSSFLTYLYVVFIWKLPSTIQFMRPFEDKILNTTKKAVQKEKAHTANPVDVQHKIFDIKTGKAIKEDY